MIDSVISRKLCIEFDIKLYGYATSPEWEKNESLLRVLVK